MTFTRRSVRASMLAALATTLVILTGCAAGGGGGGGDDGEDAKTIALFLPNTASIRFTTIDGPTFEKKVKELCPTCEVIVQNAGGDSAEQQAQIESAVVQGADVLVVDPFDAGSLAGVLGQATAAGIPVISYDALISNAQVDFYVSFENTKVGQLLAESLLGRMDELGTSGSCIVAIRGDAGDSNQAMFWDGSEPVFKEAGADVCFDVTTPGWASEPAQANMDQAITKVGLENIGGVYSMNDSMAAGVAASLINAGADPFPPVTGQDGDIAAVQRILEGTQYMTVWKDTFALAGKAAEVALALANGEKPESNAKRSNDNGEFPAYLIDPGVVTIDNINDTVISSGFISIDDLCTDQYAALCEKAGVK